MKTIEGSRGTPTPKVDLESFSSEDNVSRVGNPHGEKKRNEHRKKERLEDEKRDENHVEQEQSLRGDVFYLNISVDCTFDHGICDWKQDVEDDFDWNPADRDNAVGYYMAVSALTGQKKDIGRLKLLLPNLQPHSNFCLLFHYRLAGNKIIFEAERGKGKTGEIAVDGVLLVSGLCPDGLLSVDG
ncbi:hypothetical protein Celaphus_00010141 [Cervus elaphus hippelaphus]|uniref:MAM domain-containing protein n=1 Tax=Cervus elaphus hippelaphus TaxID=46360 RepID=A0A212C0V2_CEREH|nr:hypothetical protein Celaphus_00010141 [Cervus elaphus hippelaphus]